MYVFFSFFPTVRWIVPVGEIQRKGYDVPRPMNSIVHVDVEEWKHECLQSINKTYKELKSNHIEERTQFYVLQRKPTSKGSNDQSTSYQKEKL